MTQINRESNDDSTMQYERIPHSKDVFPFWYGGAASMFACLFTHPLDLAKVRLQTASQPGQNLVTIAIRIISSEGIIGAYRGLSASLLRQATYSTTRFGIYEALKDYLTKANNNRDLSTAILLPCSMLAGGIGGLVGNPSDVVNIRMQNDSSLPEPTRRNYRNALHGLARMAKEEGFGSWFRGLLPNLTRGVLMTASQVVSYDVAKQFLVKKLSFDETTRATHFSASLMAGLVATTVCSPADVVKTRIMNSAEKHQSIIAVLTTALKKEGPGFLFRGWFPSFIRLGPHTILTFVALEQLRTWRIAM
ncbi:BA75_04354T0 [Komagataella pastoris]|uniref:BA75_04354T0 n=1 Tax=Komagataella pastoris TaxID=4922 RepID=A0A1B2JJF3_PICPA|nr:BA75_04428T0 [Komagataella pastoris]ANZ78061.1 BA75_04354T0 [Komagataella pastoris]